MNISRPFVTRPVATTLLSIGLALAGLAAYFLLPVASMPTVDFPAIVVQATLPGASPETVATSVTTPLERHLSAIAGVDEMTSESSEGSSRIILVFDLDRDIHGAESDVEAAIEAARQDLPGSLRQNPTYRAFNPSDAPILILALTSDTLPIGQLYDAASTVIQQKLLQLQGVGDVTIGGSSLPAVRIDLNPQALFNYGIGLEDVRAAISAANANAPKGALEGPQHRYQLYVNDTASTPAQYRSLIIAYRNNAAVRLGDIATVSEGVEDVRNLGLADGKRAVLLIIRKQPGANVIDTVDAIKAVIPQIRASIPAGINLIVTNDRTQSIRTSLHDVEVTILIAMILVVTVVLVMLRNPRAALVPAVAVPLSLIGTFGVMYLLGYSLNNLSLMALTVATGFVVDDAIVVIENISRHVEAGMPRMQAALEGAREVGFTVLAMSCSLVAVFIPILLMGGLVGRVLREFAMTLAVTVALSLVISLTTTPMLCGRILRPPAHLGRFFLAVERGFNRLREFYGRTLADAIRHPAVVMLVLLGVVFLNFYLFAKVPKGFFPQQSSGSLIGFVRADQSISFQAMQQKMMRIVTVVDHDPAVEHVVAFTGGSGHGGGATNTGFLFSELKPLSVRKLSDTAVIARLRRSLSGITGARLFLQSAQDIRFGGRQGYAQYQYTLLSDDLTTLSTWAPKITAALEEDPALRDVNSDRQASGLDVRLHINRATAARMGVDMTDIDNTLYDAFGQRLVSTIYQDMNQYHVVMEVDPRFWQSPDTLKDIYVSTSGGALSGTESSAAAVGAFQIGSSTSGTSSSSSTTASTSPTASTTPATGSAATTTSATTTSSSTASTASNAAQNYQLNQLTNSTGKASTGAALSTSEETMVPLSAFASYGPGTTPLSVNHQGPFVATTFSFNLPEGEALGTAVAAINRTMRELHVPISIHGEFAGTAKVFRQTVTEEPLLILASLVAVYIVLGVLYESLAQPITILSTLPSSGVGAVLALILFGQSFTLIALIAVILLIGIVLKNAIMMVDVALETQRQGRESAAEAIHAACLLRFRPIMMTTMAAMLGALPLAVMTGQGSEMRQPLGIAIVGGLLISQILTLYTTPVVYIYLDRFRNWAMRAFKRRPRSLPSSSASGSAAPMTHRNPVPVALVATVCALGLSACAVGPNYHRPAAPPSKAFKEEKGWTPATPAQVTSEEWWTIYDDPVLSSLEAQVEVSNENVKSAVATYYAAREAVSVDRSGFLPDISLGFSGTRSGGSGAYNGAVSGFAAVGSSRRTVYDLDANGTWDLDIWGKLRREVESDVAKAQADAADIAAARLSAQDTLAQDYFQLRAAEQELRILKSTVKAYKVSLKIAQNQVNAGVTTLADVYSARTQLEDTVAQENSVQLTRDEMEHAIAVLIGKPPSQLAIPVGEFTSTVPVVPAGVPSQLLLRRPDIAASERALQSANAQIGVAEAGWFPSLTLTGSYGYESSSLSTLVRASNDVWSFGPSLAETLFNAGATLAQTREERALYDSAVASYRQTVLTAFQQVENDIATLQHLQREYAEDQAAVADAEKSAALTLNQYRAGIVAYTSVIVADTTLFTAQIAELTVQSQRLVASADLVDAIGGGWNSAQLKARNYGVKETLKSTVN